mmetsp:Transcript_108726/g.150360  ORF Transcript_108726/g.150360 Transcript_108726/m.150360 type:complete len:129 (+) Transcript_108726:259-645(+)
MDLIDTMGLDLCKDTRIGGGLLSVGDKGISGGERKRTAIATELLSDPSLLLLDEPTSGLDSFKATGVCKTLNKLARQGKTIIATIHQPNSESFYYFDRLILMMDGNIVFQGKAKMSQKYFEKLGYPFP